jgi:hypothetical protein
MRSNKPFTNKTFTKRVDHDGGRHRTVRAIGEPAVCKDCGAVYANRRWTAAQIMGGNKYQGKRPAEMTICPACKQASSGEPRGFVYLDGDFFVGHRKDIQSLILNEAKRAGEDNPLARILELKEHEGHKLTVTTTTEHLAQRLGHAVQKAFGGDVQYNFSHEDKISRVSWQRD